MIEAQNALQIKFKWLQIFFEKALKNWFADTV